MKRKPDRRIFYAAGALLVLFLLVAAGVRLAENAFYRSRAVEPEPPRKTVTVNGTDYFPRQDITTILVMGIDQEGPVVSSNSYRNSGEVDMAALVILDQSARSYTILCLNRDLMVQMPALGLGGRQAGTFYGQLALSHTYGSGLEDSAENTVQTVSDFLGGVKIDHYVAMNMDAIAILNDALGGVTVYVTDDFSRVDPSLPMGTVTLTGSQATTFVRARHNVGSQLNLSRMQRQKEYLNGMAAALTAKLESSDTFVAQVYDQMADYMVTNCSVNVVSGLLSRCSGYILTENLTLEGQNLLGEEFYEFHADRQALQELVLRLLYAPK